MRERFLSRDGGQERLKQPAPRRICDFHQGPGYMQFMLAFCHHRDPEEEAILSERVQEGFNY